MRKRLTVAALLIVLFAAPALAQKVYVDYDKTARFGTYKTFAWVKTEEVSLADTAPFLHSKIKNAIEYRLTQGGMRQVDEDPELYVTYHGEEQDEIRLNTTGWGYGYGGGWYSGYPGAYGHPAAYGGASTTTVSTYKSGTLIIDIWDAEKKQLIWRGTAEGTIPENSKKETKKIDSAIAKMAQKFEKMIAKGKK